MDKLDINPRIITALNRAQLTNLEKLVCMSGTEIERRANISASDAAVLLKAVSELLISQPFIQALKLHGSECPPCHKIPRLSSGCNVIDSFLRGGILCRGITEICGESACGKTQWCLQLCLAAQLPTHMKGLNAGAVYICTEDVFPNKRLMQMVSCAKYKYSDLKINWTDNIFIEHIAEIEDLEICITHKLPVLLGQGRVKLVIIDSIAALFRCEYGLKDMPKRAKLLSSFGAKLRALSSRHGCAVVCVNQVSAVVNSDSNRGNRTGSNIQPALGISWSNLVTCRLMLSRGVQGTSAGPPQRKVSVVFAPHLPNVSCKYMITNAGVKGIT